MKKQITYNPLRIDFLSLLALLFIGLKLTGYIDWAWWIVLTPVWVPFVIVLPVLFVAAVLVEAKR